MKNFILSHKPQNDLSENTLYQCTEPRTAELNNRVPTLYVDTVTDINQFSGIKIDEDVTLFVNVTPELEAVLKDAYDFKDSELYDLL